MMNVSWKTEGIRSMPMCMRSFVLTALTLSMGGCASLPDLSGYTSATNQLRQSVKSAGDAVSTEIDMLKFECKESGAAESTVKKLDKANKDFQEYWDKRNKAMMALVDYAASLEAIADSGKNGGQSAKAVGDSVEGLLGKLGIVRVATVAGVATDTIEMIYGEVAIVRAQNSLQESLEKTGPIMEEIVKIIEIDNGKLKISFEIAIDAQTAQLQRDYESVRKDGVRNDLILLRKYRNKALVEELKMSDKDKNKTKIDALAKELSIIDQQLAWLDPEWVSYKAKRDELEKRKRLGLQLIQSSSSALNAWKNSHEKLFEAVKKKHSPNIQEVLAVASDIEDLIKKWGEL